MSLVKRYIKRLERNGHLDGLSDVAYLKLMYYAWMGKRLNLKNPQTYNEKLQWLKLHDRRPEYVQMVDKYEAKQFVADRIGQTYVTPNYGVWDSFEDIDFDSLPNQFVLKCTHDCGGIVICKDKATMDMQAAKEKLEKHMKRKYYFRGREWAYGEIKPRILAEKFMEDSKTQELRDYKFFCFGGEVKALFIATDRQTPGVETKFDFFDADYNHLPFTNGHPNADVMPEKPATFEEMKALAVKLSQGIPHVRVDFYEVDGKIYFGEMTFFHWSGFVPFEPEQWDYTLGSWIQLPEKTQE